MKIIVEKIYKRYIVILLQVTALTLTFPLHVFSQTTYYVSVANGDDGADGTTVSSALKTVEQAVSLANSDDTLKIAAGIYIPLDKAGFAIQKPLVMSGSWDEGFAARDFTGTPTVFSGDVLGNDVLEDVTGRVVSGSEENSRRVIVWDASGNSYLSGVTVTGGNGGMGPGSGIYLISGNFLIENVKLVSNIGQRGTGMYVSSGVTLTMSFSEVSGNSASGFPGAGMYVEDGAEIHLTQVNFRYNKALDGSALLLATAETPAGIICTVNQCSFSDNENLFQGGMVVGIQTVSPVIFAYSTFANNTFSGGFSANSGVISTSSGNLKIYHCIFMGNSGSEVSSVGVTTYSRGSAVKFGGNIIVGNAGDDFAGNAGTLESEGYNIFVPETSFAIGNDVLMSASGIQPYLSDASLNAGILTPVLQTYEGATPVIMPADNGGEVFLIVPETETKNWLSQIYTLLPDTLLDQRLEKIIPSASGLYFAGPVHISNPDDPLPVTLRAFNAYCSGAKVSVVWEVGTEINNDYFTVERSADGYGYIPVGQISGAGNSNTETAYSFVDADPVDGRIRYYRLKQTDFNGNFAYFPPVAVQCGSANPVFDYVAYPNPAREKIYFSFSYDISPEGKIEIYNSLGMLMQTSEITREIDISGLPQGMYFIRITDGTHVLPVKKIEKSI